mmetsp:Transcript_36291/g.81723  ORF Transcript_36291/g.81723 Transcript_36291/m.81723 type:complete len:223 (+) Transcript_36291:1242-1910(+)
MMGERCGEKKSPLSVPSTRRSSFSTGAIATSSPLSATLVRACNAALLTVIALSSSTSSAIASTTLRFPFSDIMARPLTAASLTHAELSPSLAASAATAHGAPWPGEAFFNRLQTAAFLCEARLSVRPASVEVRLLGQFSLSQTVQRPEKSTCVARVYPPRASRTAVAFIFLVRTFFSSRPETIGLLSCPTERSVPPVPGCWDMERTKLRPVRGVQEDTLGLE